MCEVFCPDRRHELEGTAADTCASKRAEPKRASAQAAKQQANAVQDGYRLLHDLLTICGDQPGIRTGDALRALKAMDDAPWRNYANVGLTDIKLAELLRPSGVGPKQFKSNGVNLRGYHRMQLGEAAPITVKEG